MKIVFEDQDREAYYCFKCAVKLVISDQSNITPKIIKSSDELNENQTWCHCCGDIS